jgi:hypothetical protein
LQMVQSAAVAVLPHRVRGVKAGKGGEWAEFLPSLE